MTEFQEVTINEAFIITGAGVGMSIDPDGETFYVLHLEGYEGALTEQKSKLDVIIPPMGTQMFLDVVKAMVPQREQPL